MTSKFAAAAFGISLALLQQFACAQKFPDHPIKLVVGIGAGSSTDVVARLVSRKLTERLMQPIVVDNRTGAGGTIAAEAVARAPADGYTLLWATSSLPMFRSMYTLRFDPEKDLVAVGEVANGAMVLEVNGKAPFSTVGQLVAKAKEKSKGVSYASAGIGSNSHLAAEVFGQISGVDFLHVPYRSAAAGMMDMEAGQVDFLFDSLAAALPQIKSGAIKALAVTTTTRSRYLPDVPTMDEAGVRGFAHPVWFAVFAPAGTPKEVVSRISNELQAIVSAPKFSDELAEFGIEPFSANSEALAMQVRKETDYWARRIKAMDLQLK